MVERNHELAGTMDQDMPAAEEQSGKVMLEHSMGACKRPFVLINERELSVLRRGLTKDGWKRGLYLEPAGECRDIYSGAGLLSTANRRLEDAVVIPEAGDGAAGHYQLANALVSLAIVYGIERDRAYADKAAEILLKYAEVGRRRGATWAAGFLTEPEDEATWAIALAQAYDMVYFSRGLRDKDRKSIERHLLMPVARRLMGCDHEGSRGAGRLSAIGVIGLALKDADLVRGALESYKQWMLEQVGDDGLVKHAPACEHFDALTALVHFAEACYRCRIDIYRIGLIPGRSMKDMFLAPLRYAYPSYRLPAHDEGRHDSFLPLGLYEVAFRRWGDTSLAWVLKRGYSFGESPVNHDQRKNIGRFLRKSFYAFLFGRDLPGRFAIPAITSQVFPSVGTCYLRNSGGFAGTIDSGPHASGGHLDQQSFTLYALDQLLIPDYGVGAGTSEDSEQLRDTFAHNTVVVDGKPQNPPEPGENSLTASCFGTSLQGVECVATNCYTGVTHTRRLVMLSDTCLVWDYLESDEEHCHDWLIRCEGTPRGVDGCRESEMDCSQYPYFTREHAYRGEGPAIVNYRCDNGVLNLMLWSRPGTMDVALGTSPSGVADRPVSTLICRQRAKDAGFLAMFTPLRAEHKMAVVRNGCMLTVTSGDQVDYIFSRDTGEVPAEPIETDARFVAVRTRNGCFKAVTMVRGSRVKLNGELVLECPSAADCVEASLDGQGPRIDYRGDKPGLLKLRTTSRAIRVNGVKTIASNSAGLALIGISPEVLRAADEGRVVGNARTVRK